MLLLIVCSLFIRAQEPKLPPDDTKPNPVPYRDPIPPGLPLSTNQKLALIRIEAEYNSKRQKSATAMQTLEDEYNAKAKAPAAERNNLLREQESKRWDVLSDDQKTKILDWRRVDRWKVPLDSAIVGYWDHLETHGDYEFLSNRRMNFHDEGTTRSGKWKVTKSDNQQRMVRVKLDYDAATNDGYEVEIRFTKMNKVMLLSHNDTLASVAASRNVQDLSSP